MKRLRTILLLLMSILMCISVSAKKHEPTKILSYAIGGYSGDETALFSPEDSEARGIKKFELSETALSVSGEVEEVRRRRANDIVMACVYTPKQYTGEGSLTVSLDLTEKKIKLNDYATFAFGLGIIGGFTNNGAYTMHVELVTSDETYLSDFTIEKTGNEYSWYMVNMDLSEVYGYAEKLNVTVYFDVETMPTQVRVSAPYVNTRAPEVFDIAQQYSAGSLSALEGRVTGTLGEIVPTAHGVAVVKGRLITSEVINHGAVAYFAVEYEGVTSGQMLLTVEYADSAKNEKFVSNDITLNGDGIYTIPVKVEGEILSYTLTFYSVKCEESFMLRSVKIYGEGEAPLDVVRDIGTLDTVERKNDSIKFGGTISRDAAKEYSDASVVFYAIPGLTSNDMSTAVEIGRIKVSTRFEYTADLSQYGVNADTYMFMAAVTDGDGVVLFSSPEYFDAANPQSVQLSSIGLSGAAPVGAYESNASHVIVDVPLDKLVDQDASSSRYSLSYNIMSENGPVRKTITLSDEVVAELDRDINFYISVGVKVYLRFTSASVVDGLTYGGKADSYGICVDNEMGRKYYTAIVGFVADRYDSLTGFILGNGVNDINHIGDISAKPLQKYAEELAELCRLTYNAAAKYHQNIAVLVPFDGADSDSVISIRVLGTMLSERISKLGDMPWAVLYKVETSDGDVAQPKLLAEQLADNRLSTPCFVTYYYEPTMSSLIVGYMNSGMSVDEENAEYAYSEYAVKSFISLLERCSDAAAVFMSMEELPIRNDRNFYSVLKDSAELEGLIHESVAVSVETSSMPENVAEYTIWDFSLKHYTEGWLAGGGVESCLTDYSNLSDYSYDRVLKTVLVGDEYGGAGMALRNFPTVLDLTEVDELRFAFAITKDDGESIHSDVSVQFVIGFEDYRAEFYTENLKYDEMQTISCDISEYAYRDKVDYIGIMVYADEAISFELSSVKAYSDTLGESELSDVFNGITREESQPDTQKYMVIAIVGVLVMALTLIVAILLIRRDREDKERMRAETKTKRKAYERQYK